MTATMRGCGSASANDCTGRSRYELTSRDLAAGLAIRARQDPQVRLESRPGLADVGEPSAVGRVRRLGVGAVVACGDVLRLAPSAGTVQMSVLVDQAGSFDGLGGEGELLAVGRPGVVGRAAERGRGGVDLELGGQVAGLAGRASATKRWLRLPSSQRVPVADHQAIEVRTLLLDASFSLSLAAVCSGVMPGVDLGGEGDLVSLGRPDRARRRRSAAW